MKPLKIILATLLCLLLVQPSYADDRYRKGVALVAGLSLLNAALQYENPRNQLKLRTGTASEPEFGVESYARPGEAIYATYNYLEGTMRRSTDEYNERLKIPPRIYYRTNAGEFCQGRVCMDDDDNDGDFDKAGIENGERVDVPYVETSVRLPPEKSGFRSELVYLGLADGVLRLLYREFVNDLARPAFSLPLEYQVEEFPAKIAFQDLLFEVKVADNLGVVYITQISSAS